MESFNIRFRDEFLNIELFTSVQEAKMLASCTESRDICRTHSAPQGRTLLEIHHQWKAA